MSEKRYSVYGKEIVQGDECWAVAYSEYNADVIATALNKLAEEKEYYQIKSGKCEEELLQLRRDNKQLKHFIQELTTKGTGRIDLADGYSYSVSAVLTNWKGDVE